MKEDMRELEKSRLLGPGQSIDEHYKLTSNHDM